MDDQELAKRTEWLNDFHEAQWTIRATLREFAQLTDALYIVGSAPLADRITEHCGVINDAFEVMNNAMSRNIYEDAQASWNQIGETFVALLQATGE